MVKKIRFYFSFLLILFSLFGVVGNGYGVTYKLTQVTGVTANNKYVLVEDGHALIGTVTNNKLQSTASYSTTSLSGSEIYVWALESSSNGFYMKNGTKYLNNASSTTMSLGNKSSEWTFTFSGSTAEIKNRSNSNRYIGETSNNSYEYKAYSETGHAKAFTVYLLEIESEDIHVSSVSLDENETELEVGATQTLTATILPSNATNKSVTWESKTGNVSVSNGVVVGISEGVDTVVVHTVDGGKTDTCFVTVTPYTGDCYDFSDIPGFTSWGNSYKEHTLDYEKDIVVFGGASKQTNVIKTIPVVKNDSICVYSNKDYITGCFLTCEQWVDKAKTVSLYYSTDKGDTWIDADTTSSAFNLIFNDLPSTTNAIKFKFSSDDNQVGIARICLKHEDAPCVKKTITFINKNDDTEERVEYCAGKCFLPEINKSRCFNNYWEFIGWSEKAYGNNESDIIRGSYTLEDDITLYAVFRHLDAGSAGGYVLVETDLNTDWAGEYLIAYSTSIIADGSTSGESGIGAGGSGKNPGVNLTGKTINSSWGDTYNVVLEEISDGSNTYVLKTKDDKYNYRTTSSTGGSISASDNKSTAASYPISITFNSSSNIKLEIKNAGWASGQSLQYNTGGSGFFRYYTSGNQQPIFLYKKQCGYVYEVNPDNIQMVEWNPEYVKLDIVDADSIILNNDIMLLPEREIDGSYKVDTLLGDLSCTDFKVITKKTDNTECVNIFKVPIFVESTTDNTGIIHADETDSTTCDVVILGGGKLTLTDNLTNRDVTIYPEGRLVIPEGKTYTANTLTLRRDNNDVPYFLYNGEIDITKEEGFTFELRTDGDDWRWVTLPFAYKVSDIMYSDGSKPALNSDLYVSYYDGKYRSRHMSGAWKDIANDGPVDTTFNAGEGFLIGANLPGHTKKNYQFIYHRDSLANEKNNKTIGGLHAWGGGDETLAPNHKGWNMIGNPYMENDTTDLLTPIRIGYLEKQIVDGKWTGGWNVAGTDKTLRYAVIPSDKQTDEVIAAGGYESVLLDDVVLKPFTCFFVQIGGEDEGEMETITFKEAKRVNKIVARRTQENVNDEILLRVKVGDLKTGCFISNRFIDDYEPGDDLESNYSLYQSVGGYRLLYSAINDSTMESGILVYTPAGNLHLDEKTNINDFEEINAYYNNEWYNLLQGQTVNVQGNFILQARRKQNNVATGFPETKANTETRKFIYQGNLYILNNNCIFDVFGKRIK